MPRCRAVLLSSFLSVVVTAAWAPRADGQPRARPSKGASKAPSKRAAEAPEEPAPAEAAPKSPAEEAREHFDKGVALFKQNAIDAALAELLESRRLYPTKSATEDIAICLRKLSRFDEALGMYETLLREFPDLPADTKANAQREVVELRGLVGRIEVSGAEVGASVTIDGQRAGDYPLIEPLRVPAGSHVVRVYKEGFEPFELRVAVAGGKVVEVKAPLRALRREATGRLLVIERGGKALDVLVDGVTVGKTPRWEGPLATGSHTVALRGEGALGTPPVSVPVKLGQVTPLSLSAESLGGALKIVPEPAGASMTIDGVPVGRGIWEGPLREGTHQIEVAAEGFLPALRQVSLEGGEREVIEVSLERDPSSARWRKPSRFFLEIDGAAVLAPTLGGDFTAGCAAGCAEARRLGLGGHGVFHGGYALGVGPSFGVTAGYLWAYQRALRKGAAVKIVADAGDKPRGDVEDALTLSGFLAGAFVGMSFGQRAPFHLRLGAGALLGSIIDSRTVTLAGPPASSGRRGITRADNFFWLAPEMRLGVPLGDHVELSLGAEALILLGLGQQPVWQPVATDEGKNLYINAGVRGAAEFPAAPILGRTVILITPGIGLRVAF